MADRARPREWPRAKRNGPREIEPSSAAPGSTEQELGEIAFKDTRKGGDLQNGAADGSVRFPPEDSGVRSASGDLVRFAQEARARSGSMPVGTGHGIYGFDYDRELGRRVVNSAEAKVVLWVFETFDAGETVSRIARRLNDQAIPSKRGMRWGYAVVLSMLRNRSYLGVDYYGKTRTMRTPDGEVFKVPTQAAEWVRVTGFTPPLVPEELFERVQSRLRDGLLI